MGVRQDEDTALGASPKIRKPPVVVVAILLIVAAAASLRIHVAATATYLPDEHELAIPLAESISFSASALNLPIRGRHHPALPSYFIKASMTVAGRSPLGYRLFHVLAGLATILIVFRMTADWSGDVAALWAAALLAFNEYHIGVSSFATAKGPHLLLIVLALWSFSRFLKRERPGALYAAAAMTGLAFYCKEHSALLLPVFFLTLCQRHYRGWLGRRHVYLAGVVFLVVIAPDVLWNLRYMEGNEGVQATYRDHLSRIGGLGFTPHYFLFFARDVLQWLSVTFTGEMIPDSVAENPSMNSLAGLLLLGTVTWWTFKGRPTDSVGRFHLLLFWFVLGFFVLVRPGRSPVVPLDAVAWYWVDATMFPAVIVAGHVLAGAERGRRTVLWGIAVCAIVYASVNALTLPARLPDILRRTLHVSASAGDHESTRPGWEDPVVARKGSGAP